MTDVTNFYRQFEDRYRGSQTTIENRLRFYLPWIAPLQSLSSEPPKAMDLGCGRGEWLQLLVETGFLPVGIDQDEGMLQACREKGLSVERGDVLKALKATADQSQLLVSAFHLIEHLPFDDMHTIVAESMRVLKPGGLLILETPNPENIRVATSGFYLDPSHQRPVPPLLLSFLVEHVGFERVQLVRLHEPEHVLHAEQWVTLEDVLGGVSPDYAVIAQKGFSDGDLAAWDAVFATQHGATLDDLLQRRLTQQELRWNQPLVRLSEHDAQIDALQTQLHAMQFELTRLNALLSWPLRLREAISKNALYRAFKKWRK